MTKRFNRERFVKFILLVVEDRGLTRAQAEHQAGVYRSFLTKLHTQRAGVKADSLLALCAWAGADPMTFYREEGEQP